MISLQGRRLGPPPLSCADFLRPLSEEWGGVEGASRVEGSTPSQAPVSTVLPRTQGLGTFFLFDLEKPAFLCCPVPFYSC